VSDPRLDQLTDFTFAYTGGPRFYVGFETLVRTASASGLGSESATRFVISFRSGSASAVGSGSASSVLVALRTASGSATGSESATSNPKALRSASGSGAGSSTSTEFKALFRSALAAGAGGSAASAVSVRFRTATGAGTSGGSASAIEILPRTATASGTGSTGGQVTWVKSFIFRPPVNDSFSWANRHKPVPGDFVLRKLVPGDRAKNVYKLLDGSYTFNQPSRPEQYTRLYLGGHNNFVSAEEKQDLIAAGFGDLVT
jgi:hypothetical protein